MHDLPHIRSMNCQDSLIQGGLNWRGDFPSVLGLCLQRRGELFKAFFPCFCFVLLLFCVLGLFLCSSHNAQNLLVFCTMPCLKPEPLAGVPSNYLSDFGEKQLFDLQKERCGWAWIHSYTWEYCWGGISISTLWAGAAWSTSDMNLQWKTEDKLDECSPRSLGKKPNKPPKCFIQKAILSSWDFLFSRLVYCTVILLFVACKKHLKDISV